MLRGASASVRTFASLRTPTTSHGGSSRRRSSRPTASPSVQERRAVVSLTMNHGVGVPPVGAVEVAPAEDIEAQPPRGSGIDLGPIRDVAAIGRRLEAVDVEVA